MNVDNAISNVLSSYSSGLTTKQQEEFNKIKDKLSPQDAARYEVQMTLQNQQEVMAFISNVLKKRNEIAMSVINNLR